MIRNRILQFLGLAMVAIFAASCGDETKSLDQSLFGYQYFPIEIGNYRVYRIDSLVVDNNGGDKLESTTFVREEITDVFINPEGDSVYRIERSKSTERFGSYVISDVWTTEKNLEVAIRTEENLRFNKLVFPIVLNDTWEGNTFDNQTVVFVAGESVKVYKDWGDYKVIANGIDLTVNGKVYNDVVTVEQADHDFTLERRVSIEHFAPNIGLIRKEMTILDTQCDCPGETWLEKADRGFIMSQVLVEHN